MTHISARGANKLAALGFAWECNDGKVRLKRSNMIKFLILFLVMVFIIAAAVTPEEVRGDKADTYIDSEYVRYCEYIGNIYCISPELLEAMIETESSGNPEATNNDCKGLMQVMEGCHTGRMNRLNVKDIYDPYGNILVAADYLSELLCKYEDIAYCLDIYNGNTKAEDNYDQGIISEYAAKIIERSAQLERIHGK